MTTQADIDAVEKYYSTPKMELPEAFALHREETIRKAKEAIRKRWRDGNWDLSLNGMLDALEGME